MTKPRLTIVVFLSLAAIISAIASFWYWASFAQVTAQISDITFSDSSQSQLIEYSYNDKNYEAEFTLYQARDGQNIPIRVDKDNPGDFLLEPSQLRKNTTLASGVLGLTGLFYVYVRKYHQS